MRERRIRRAPVLDGFIKVENSRYLCTCRQPDRRQSDDCGTLSRQTHSSDTLVQSNLELKRSTVLMLRQNETPCGLP